MKRALAVLVTLALSAAARGAADGPGEVALSFLRGLTEENGGIAVGETAISPDTPEENREDIAQRLSRLGRGIRPDDLRVLDGSVVPSNIGVNPSLTITALAERAMALR